MLGAKTKPPEKSKAPQNAKSTENCKEKSELAEYLANKWLHITYKNGNVTALKCSVYTRYGSKINTLSNYNPIWSSKGGCRKLQKQSAEEHAHSGLHDRALGLYLKEK